METTEYISVVREKIGQARAGGKRIVLIPTMGWLHDGHLSMVKAARADLSSGGFIVMSVFVNPLQFGPQEDFEKYPRDLAGDTDLARGAGVDMLFAPTVQEMYPGGESLTIVRVGGVSEGLCGASRPGHFDGVATVVTKLLHICQPDVAYFGQKDYQQLMVIRQMVRDLCMNVEIVSVPIYREADGLAMSSRNVYLGHEHRKQAPVLYEALQEGAKEVVAGEKDGDKVCAVIREKIEHTEAQVEYVEMREEEEAIVILLAARLGETRLIDNIVIAKVEDV
ncbi:MAG: pantoate--beta-alanine ligase [Peptococcaceae bacterium]|nr:pantoate--beta-alanine ligase [Peptococcaceae bacterium]